MGLHHRNLRNDDFKADSLVGAESSVGFLGVPRILSDRGLTVLGVAVVVMFTIGLITKAFA